MAIQQMLKQVGITMTIQSNEMSTFFADIGTGNFQMYSLSRNGISDPDFSYVIFYSKNIPPEGQNRGYYSNPRVDQLLVEGRSTFDRARRKPVYEEIQKIVATELPYISLSMQDNVAIMRSYIDGYVQYPAGFYLSVPQMGIK
jgi:peptide/nickel transport system substrate-binding protein